MMINLLEKKRWFAITLTILIAIEIFWFSSLTETTIISTGKPVASINAIIYHFSVFFLFTFFLLSSIKTKPKITIKDLTITAIISILYAILDEVHQIFVPGRNSSIRDFMTDTTGIFFAMLIYWFIDKKSKQST